MIRIIELPRPSAEETRAPGNVRRLLGCMREGMPGPTPEQSAGFAFARARVALNLTLRQAAHALGVTPIGLSDVEHGRARFEDHELALAIIRMEAARIAGGGAR